MSIALKMKRAVASLSAGAIFASLFVFGAGNVSAAEFTDVKVGVDWGAEEIYKLVEAGVIDANTTFRKDDTVLRGEFFKMVAEAGDFMAGCEQPATPTWTDAPAGRWDTLRAECLGAAGVVTGDTNPVTKLPIGTVRLDKIMNRVEGIAVVMRAFEIPADLDPAAPFSDNKEEWYKDMVTSAYNAGIVKGSNGLLLPGNPMTRREAAVFLYRAMNFDETVTPPCDVNSNDLNCPGPNPGTSTGSLEVSLNANTPKGLNAVPKKANGVRVFDFDVSAVTEDVTLTNLIVKRSGAGEKTDIAAAYLYEGDIRRTTERTVNSDTNEVSFTLKNFVVKKGEKRTLSLVVDISDTAVSNSQHAFSIVAADKVTHNGVKTTGAFSIQGETFTIGGVSVSDIEIEKGSVPSKAQLGSVDQKVASLKITAGDNDVTLERLALTNGGSLASEELANCKLLRASDELAMTKAFEGDILTFDLAKPFLIEEGQSRTFDVTCNIIGGRPGDNVILYLDVNADLSAADVDFGFGANVINSFSQTDANTVEIEGGVVTAFKTGPISSDIAQNTTNNALVNYSVIAERDLTVRDTGIEIQLEADGNGPDLTTLGNTLVNDVAADTSAFTVDASAGFAEGDTVKLTATSGTVYAVITDVNVNDITTDLVAGDALADNSPVVEANPYTFVKNVKVIDADTKATVIDSVTDATTGATVVEGVAPTGDSYFRTHPQDYELLAGKERHFSLMVDLDANMPSGYQVRGLVFLAPKAGADSFIKDDEANKLVPTEDVVTSPVIGNYMFTAENTISIGLANTPTSNNFVAGDPEVEGLGISITAGDAGDTRINSLKLRVYGCDDTNDGVGLNNTVGIQCFEDTTGGSKTWESPLGNKAANTIVSTVNLYEAGKAVTTAKNVKLVNVGGGALYDAGTDYYIADFDGLDLVVKAGQTRTLTAVAASLNNFEGVVHLALDLNPADIDAEDAEDANTIDIAGASLNAGLDKDPLITFGQSGSLTATSEGNPNAGIVLFDAKKQLFSKYTFNSQDEDTEVNRLTIMQDGSGDFNAPTNSNAVKSVIVRYTDKNNVVKEFTQPLVGGKATFTGLDIYVKAGQPKTMEVLADLNGGNIDNLTGTHVRLGLQNVGNTKNTFEAIGVGSQETEYFADAGSVLNGQAPKDFVLRKAMPVFTQNSTSPILDNAVKRELYDVDVAAASTSGFDSIDLNRMVFNVTLNDKNGGNELTLSKFQLTRGGVLVDQALVNIVDANTDADLQGLGVLQGPTTTFKVVVSMLESNPVTADKLNFMLSATVAGVEDGDSINVGLSDEDEAVEANALNAVANPNKNGNTGQLIAGAGLGIFTTAVGYMQDVAGDLTVLIDSADFIWSDNSGQPHVFTTDVGDSSFDFTNGFRLRLNALNDIVMSE